MLTADRVREYTGESGVLALFRDLGYPVSPVAIDPDEWRRGGVAIPWDARTPFRLAARLRHFDLFLLAGPAARESIAEFLSSYKKYNQITKSVIIQHEPERSLISIYDLSHHGTLRLFEVDRLRPSLHAVDRLNLLRCGEESALPRVFDRALDREGITRRFFRRFRAATSDVASAIAGLAPGEERAAVEGEALLILSRLLFLSFIQEKGWLDGQRRFLVDHLEHEMERGREFFSGVLLPLFFGCLNTPIQERTLGARRLGAIPYLNGGLFEPSAFERRHPVLHLPNELFGTILEEVFEKFDFRAEEGEGLGTHVDPEMLGRVFESLMAEDERSESGSYYTPKEIVDALTQRAITEWVDRDENPQRRLERLERITVLDPACGSGAFLLSALTTIEKMWERLAGQTGAATPSGLRSRIVSRCLYGVDLKPEAVRLCELRLWLAIVSSTDLPVEQIEPLPNLDRNILQGNSLLGPTDFLGDARLDVYRDWLHSLNAQRDLLQRYRTAPHAHRPALARVIRGNDLRLATDLLVRRIESDEAALRLASAPRQDLFGRAMAPDSSHCLELRTRIEEGKSMLERVEEGSLDFFSFDVHFAPVMAEGGFDVVVGNPPWVRNARIDSRAKRVIAERFKLFRKGSDERGVHQPDLSLAFFERAVQLATPDGVTALLMPAKIANATYATALRRHVSDHLRVVALCDWSDDERRRRWFEADTFPLGIVVSGDRRGTRGPIEVTTAGHSFELPSELLASETTRMEWSLVPTDVAVLLRRLRHDHRTLSDVLGRRPFMGVKTGANGLFFVEVKSVDRRSATTTDGHVIPLAHLCRCIRGRDLRRWSGGPSRWMLWPPANGWRTAPEWLSRFADARGVEPAALTLSFVRPEHVGVKVAWKDLSRGMSATVLPDSTEVECGAVVPLIPNQTLYAIDTASLEEAHALAGLLNSVVADALLLAVAERAKDRHYRYFGRTVAALPVPEGSRWEDLARYAKRASRGCVDQRAIDNAAARAYGIGDGEANLLREFIEERLGARASSG